MQLVVEELANGVTKAVLSGRMDIEGAQAVDMRFNVIAGAKKAVVVDMSGVSFIASMGLRTLMVAARAISNRGGRMAIAAAQPNVLKVLTSSGADEVIVIADSLESAIVAVGG